MKKSLLLSTAALGIALLPFGTAQAQEPVNWSGFYMGLHGGYVSGDATLSDSGPPSMSVGGSVSGFIGGGLAGYNFQQAGPFVFGLETDFGVTDATGHAAHVAPEADAAQDLYTYDLNWNGHLRAKAGLPMGEIMPFLAAGLAVADFDVTHTSFGPPNTMGGLYTGVTVGGGVDAMFGPKFIGRAEVLYDSYGSRTYGDCLIGLNTWTVRVAAILKLP